MSPSRVLRRPTLEAAANRVSNALAAARRRQKNCDVFVTIAVVGAGYWLADLGFGQLLLLLFAGLATRQALLSWWTARIQHRNVGHVGSLDPRDAPTVARGLRELRRQAYGSTLLAVLLLAGYAKWAGMEPTRVWVSIAGVVGLVGAYAFSTFAFGTRAGLGVVVRTADDTDCRIALFRAFEAHRSSLARHTLVPILAGYGRVDIVLDPSLRAAGRAKPLSPAPGRLGDFAQVHAFRDEQWQDGVAELLEDTDIVVIDLSIIRPGVAWELANSYARLPPHRILCMLDQRALKGSDLMDHVRKLYATVPEGTMPTNVRPYVFVFSPGSGHAEVLALELHRKMTEIVAIESGVMERPDHHGEERLEEDRAPSPIARWTENSARVSAEVRSPPAS